MWIRLLRTARTEHIRYKRFPTETCMSERAVFYRNAALSLLIMGDCVSMKGKNNGCARDHLCSGLVVSAFSV